MFQNPKAAFTKQTNVGQLVLANSKLVCVNDTTTCWQTVGDKQNLSLFSPTVCQPVVVSFTHTNLSLPTPVGKH